MAFSVDPFGPSRRCRLFTKRSLLPTMPPIFIMSHSISSSRIFRACGAGTLRDRSFIRSLALMMMYGSYAFRVVATVIEPSTRFSSHLMPCSFKAAVTLGHTSLRYFSLYLGNNTAKELSSIIPVGLSSLEIFTVSQCLISLLSQGLSFLKLFFCLGVSSAAAVSPSAAIVVCIAITYWLYTGWVGPSARPSLRTVSRSTSRVQLTLACRLAQ
mmetsp:Transcript_3057/g.11011  ORF Transcript_3057/g.11011 Transcript_3057/m.11011 type:complete len:213 (+) Transcript_3057:730-1368(+)